ncbi:hypothetical protein [Sphingomonas psychrotolerans]|uniref:Uncharacterized protein n=1 Tax=Sphingomonas psychrotolerans TaxID=1327635 RepID=A0A2K8MAB6_9SPHN|nr:hypothetical protein [Sphingomonas psychrotolerans]ATY30820.1 hypothetical protein CVN68_01470 [Sphingomonas psychrotolerans]
MTFPTYDADSDSIRLNGGAAIMLALLMKSKFGERFDVETMFHPQLPGLINQLYAATGHKRPAAGECFDRMALLQIAERVLKDSVNIGWWSMRGDEKRDFLQGAASPWILTAEQLETIIQDVDDDLNRQREVVALADRENI